MAKYKRSALARSVAAYNKRISRAIKANPEMASILPAKESARELKRMAKSQADIQRMTKELKRFQAPQMQKVIKTESGFAVTKWELARAQRLVERANITRENMLKIQPKMETGWKRPRKEALQYKQAELNLKRFANTVKGREEWQRYLAWQKKLMKTGYVENITSNYKAAYIEKVQNNLGSAGAPLVRLIRKIDDEKFYTAQYKTNFLSKDELPSKPEDDAKAKEISEFLIESWTGYIAEAAQVIA
jgi:hypothetical protein